MAEDRFYSFKCVSYDNIDNIIKNLDTRSAKYYIIEHDKDINENGELKKSHNHIVFTVPVRMGIKQVRNLLRNGTDQNTLVEYCEDLTYWIRYLTHKDDKGKYQYLDEEVITNSSDGYKRLIGGKTTSDEEANEAFCNDLLKLNVRQMAIKYGRDYMRNYKSYENFKHALMVCDNEENLKVRELETDEELL